MGSLNGSFLFVACPCGKTLRIAITLASYGKEITVACKNCQTRHKVRVVIPGIPMEAVNLIKSYTNLMQDVVAGAVGNFEKKGEIASIKQQLEKLGFSLSSVFSSDITLSKIDNMEEKERVKKEDDKFLRSLNIKTD